MISGLAVVGLTISKATPPTIAKSMPPSAILNKRTFGTKAMFNSLPFLDRLDNCSSPFPNNSRSRLLVNPLGKAMLGLFPKLNQECLVSTCQRLTSQPLCKDRRKRVWLFSAQYQSSSFAYLDVGTDWPTRHALRCHQNLLVWRR